MSAGDPAVALPNPTAEERDAIEATLLALRDSGFRPHIIVDKKTRTILDGVLTKEICEVHEIGFDVIEIDVVDPVEVRLRLAFARRQTSESIRAMTTVIALGKAVQDAAALRRSSGKKVDQVTPASPGRTLGKTVEILAEIAGVGTNIIGQALRVQKHPDLVRRVLEDGLALSAAASELKAEKDRRTGHALAGGDIRWASEDVRKERDRRFTPADRIGDPYRAMVGGDFIDVATEVLPDRGNPMRAPFFLTEADDGIAADWGPPERPAYCNKPFRLRGPYLARALREAVLGRTTTFLETNDTGTPVAQAALRHCHDVVFLDGRPQYLKPDGKTDKRPTFATVLYGIGGEIGIILKHGARGVACTPNERVEQMLDAAIAAMQAGSSSEDAKAAAHRIPGVPVPNELLTTLDAMRRDKNDDGDGGDKVAT